MNPIDLQNMLVAFLYATVAKLFVLLLILSSLEVYVWHTKTTDRNTFCAVSGVECLSGQAQDDDI